MSNILLIKEGTSGTVTLTCIHECNQASALTDTRPPDRNINVPNKCNSEKRKCHIAGMCKMGYAAVLRV